MRNDFTFSGSQDTASLLKTHYRDSTFTKAENYAAKKLLIELMARHQPPSHVPAMRETGQIYGSQFQHIPNSDLSGLIHPDGSVSWGMTNWGAPPREIRRGWVELYAKIYNICIAEAVQQLARRYGINENKPLELTIEHTMFPINGENHPLPEGQMEIDGIAATHIETIEITFPCRGAHCLLAMFKTPLGKVAHQPYYKAFDGPSDDPQAFLWGLPAKNIPISELDVLERHPLATVLLTDDAWLAHRINCFLQSLGEPIQIVATSIWAGISRLDDYSFEALLGRRIVYLPTLHKDALAAGIQLREILHGVEVEDFKILMEPFANDEDSIEAAKPECGEYATAKAVVFSRRNVLYLLDDIHHAWQFDRYRRFCQQERLIEIESQPDEKSAPSLFLSATAINTIANSEGQQDDFSFSNVFAPSNITVIVGDSDTGKTMFTRTIAVAITTGTAAFGIKASVPRSVYIVNAEQDVQKSSGYTMRAMSSLGIMEIPERLFDLPELSSTTPDGFDVLDVLAPEWQDLIIEQLSPDSVLIIDNLLAASVKDLSHATVARALRQFAKRLQERGISLIVIHHTGKDGKAMGSQALENLAQNYILMHRVDSEKNAPGVNAIVTFRKIKNCPQIKGKKFNAHLAHASTLETGTPWVFEEVGKAAPGATPIPRQKPDVAGLHEIEQAALLHAYEHGKVTKSDLIQKGFKDGTVKDHLAALVKANKLEQKGSGPGTHYVLPEATS